MKGRYDSLKSSDYPDEVLLAQARRAIGLVHQRGLIPTIKSVAKIAAGMTAYGPQDVLCAQELAPILSRLKQKDPLSYLDRLVAGLEKLAVPCAVGDRFLRAFVSGVRWALFWGRQGEVHSLLRETRESFNPTLAEKSELFLTSLGRHPILSVEDVLRQRFQDSHRDLVGSEAERQAASDVIKLSRVLIKKRPYAAMRALIAVHDAVEEGSAEEKRLIRTLRQTFFAIHRTKGAAALLGRMTTSLRLRPHGDAVTNLLVDHWCHLVCEKPKTRSKSQEEKDLSAEQVEAARSKGKQSINPQLYLALHI